MLLDKKAENFKCYSYIIDTKIMYLKDSHESL